MGFFTRIALAIGLGAMLFAIIMTLSVSGVNFFADSFYTTAGFIAFVLWIFDYLTYFMAT